MESGRVPFPAARDTKPNVGTTRNKRPDIAPCAYAQIGSVLRCGQHEHWQVRSNHLRQVQRRNIRAFSETIIAPPNTRQTDGDHPGQCPIPPCGAACSIVGKISQNSEIGISAAIQPATCSNRASMEACQAHCNTQPILCNVAHVDRGRRIMFRPMEKTKPDSDKIMRHNLSRHV